MCVYICIYIYIYIYTHTYIQGGVMGAFKISGRGDVISPGVAWADVLVQPTTIDLFYSLYAACRCVDDLAVICMYVCMYAYSCRVCTCTQSYTYIIALKHIFTDIHIYPHISTYAGNTHPWGTRSASASSTLQA